MALTTQRLIDSRQHNRALIREIEDSGIKHLFDTRIIHEALHSIEHELRRRGVAF